MKFLLLPLLFLLSTYTQAQYYYNDIITTREANKQLKAYVDNKVKTVSAIGYDENGTRATDFSETREVKDGGKTIRVSSIVKLAKTVSYSKFDANGRLITTIDSTGGVESITTYEYDGNGRLIELVNRAKDPNNDFTQVEKHRWSYTATGQPEKMWRTINNADSLEIRFVPDEKGNPGEEVYYKNGREADRVYYYFDEKGRISDIVRYNNKIKKLMPENIITYDDADRIIQMMASIPADKYGKMTWVSYQTMRYIYNEQGLKTAEAMFNGDQQMTGRIKYNFTFGQ